MIKESCNLIGPEKQLNTPNQSLILPSVDYLQTKTPRYQLTLSRDIDDQRILQSDWLRAL